MTARIINRRDLEFVLFELLDTESLTVRPRFADHTRETFLAALDTAEAIAADKFAPHNRKADEHEPQAGSSLSDIVTSAAPNPECSTRCCARWNRPAWT